MTGEDLRRRACCFSGHRAIPASHLPALRRRLTEAVTRLAEEGFVYFIVGGALGFDTLAAEAVLSLRDSALPHIRLLLAIPHERQAASWPAADREKYERIKAAADKARVLSPHYYTGCMQARNRYMVDHASVCVCYLTKENGGTAGTVRYAEKKGLTVIDLASSL